MNVLVVGLRAPAHQAELARALTRHGLTLDVARTTDLVVEVNAERFHPRLRQGPLKQYRAVLLWSLGVRRWEWYLALDRLHRSHQVRVVDRRPFDPEAPTFLSTAWQLGRFAEEGIRFPPVVIVSDRMQARRALEMVEPPLMMRGMSSGNPRDTIPVEPPERLPDILETRSERAFLIFRRPDVLVRQRFLIIGGQCHGVLGLDGDPQAPAARWTSVSADPGLLRLAEAAVRAVRVDLAEVEVGRAPDGGELVLHLTDGLEHIAWDRFGASGWAGLAAFLAREVGAHEATPEPVDSGPRPTASAAILLLTSNDAVAVGRQLSLARRLSDEVWVIDCASTDGTLDLARGLADHVVEVGDETLLPAAWQAVLERVESSHVLWLMGVDRIEEDEARELLALAAEMPDEAEGVAVPWSMLRDGNGEDRERPTVPRLVRREVARRLGPPGPVELWRADGMLRLDGPVVRYSPVSGTRAKDRQRLIDRIRGRAPEADPATRAQRLLDLGEALVRIRAYADALGPLEDAVAVAPAASTRGRARTLLALARLRLGDRAGCVDAATTALAEEPRLMEAAHVLGEAAYDAKDFHAARAWLERAVATPLPTDIDPLYPYWYTWFTADLLSVTCERAGDLDAALRWVKVVQNRVLGDERINENRARIEAALKRREANPPPPAGAPLPLPDRSLSVCIIVKDEGEGFRRALRNLHLFADEIVVVDTGSRDNTVEVAKEYTPHVLHFPWIDDFSAARNFSIDHATGTHFMWLDSDDEISEEDASRLRQHFAALQEDVEVVYLPYVYSQDAGGNARYIQLRERLFRRLPTLRFQYPIHEVIPVDGRPSAEWNDVTVLHHIGQRPGEDRTERNLRILRKALEDPRWAGDRHLSFHLAKELYGLKKYEEAVPLYERLVAESDDDLRRGRMAFRLAKCFWHLKAWADCRSAAELSMACVPHMREPFVVMGFSFHEEGRLEEAREWYERALTIPLGRHAIHQHWYQYRIEEELVDVYLRLGQLREAEEAWKTLATHLPNERNTRLLRQRLDALAR